MCAVAVTCGSMKIGTTRSCPRTPSAPIHAISARGGQRPRTYSGQRWRIDNHNRALTQVRDIFGYNSVNTVKPSAQPTLVRTQHLPRQGKQPLTWYDGSGAVVMSGAGVGSRTPLRA